MPTLSNGIVYQDLGTRDASEMAEYARQERERRRQAQQNAAPSPQPAPQQNSVPKTVQDRGPDVKTAPSAPMDAAEQTRRSQLQDGAKSAYNNYLTSFGRQIAQNDRDLVATGRSIMDTAYVFNESWNAVKNGTAFAGTTPEAIQNQRMFVMNSALAFGDAAGKAHGWQLVDGEGTDVTGYDSKTGTWNFVYKDRGGNTITRSTTMDQIAKRLKDGGYYGDASETEQSIPASTGGTTTPTSSAKPTTDQTVANVLKEYAPYYETKTDENGNKVGQVLSLGGIEFMTRRLKSATGTERDVLLHEIANATAASNLKAGKTEDFKADYNKAYNDLETKYPVPLSTEQTGTQSAPPRDALEAFAKDVNLREAGLGRAYDRASARRENYAELSDLRRRKSNGTLTPGGKARLQELEGDTPLTDEQRAAMKRAGYGSEAGEERKRVAAEMTKKNFDSIRAEELAEKIAAKSDKAVQDFDKLLAKYNDEDDKTYQEFVSEDNLLSEDEYLDNSRKQNIAREKEMFAVVREMSPEQRQAILSERDSQGHFTERARRMRSALLYARDMGTLRGFVKGGQIRKDASVADRDSEVAALAAVDTNDANIRRAMRASAQSKPNTPTAAQEPAPQEPVAVAPDTTEPAPVQEVAPQAQNEASAEVVSQQELSTVEPPANESTVSEPENKPEPSGDNAEKNPNNDDAWLEKARNNVDKAFMKKWRYGGDARDAFREAKPKLIKWVSEKTKNNRYFTMPRGYRTEDQRMILEAILEDMNLPKGDGKGSWILNSKNREELVRRINAISL